MIIMMADILLQVFCKYICICNTVHFLTQTLKCVDSSRLEYFVKSNFEFVFLYKQSENFQLLLGHLMPSLSDMLNAYLAD